MKIVAFTGVGISKSAGIPTFKGIKEKLSVEFRDNNPEEFESAINKLREMLKDKDSFIKKVESVVEELR
jgi:NAD-dependent SIR2 family protein deacetylase